MAYVKTNWVDDVTPLSATNMNNIEDTLNGLGNVTHEIASQAEAEAGTSDIKYMTPLRTRQAIFKNPLGGSGLLSIAGVVSQIFVVTHNLGRPANIQYWGDLGGGDHNNYISQNTSTQFAITLKSTSGVVGSGMLTYEYW